MLNFASFVRITVVALSFLLSACQDGTSLPNDAQADASVGKGGSTSRFSIIDGFLYVVESSKITVSQNEEILADAENTTQSRILTFAISAATPQLIDEILVEDVIETVFPYQLNSEKMLLIGAQNAMYIYPLDAQGKINIASRSQLTHARSCDPVVAYGNYAYVTLRASFEGGCVAGENSLQVMDISDIHLPVKISTQSLYGPKGLSVSEDGRWLFVCDEQRLVQFSLANPEQPQETTIYPSVNCLDIIAYGGKYFVTGQQLLQQFNFDSEKQRLQFEVDLLSSNTIE